MSTHSLGILGLGTSAHDPHPPAPPAPRTIPPSQPLPVIKANPSFELLAVSSQRGLSHEDAKYTFQDYRELLKVPQLEAVAICTPPQVRHVIAREALLAGKSVLLEK